MNNSQFANPSKSPVRQHLGRAFIVVGSTIATAANAAIDISSVTAILGDGVVAAAALGVGFLAFSGGIAIWNRLKSAAK